MVLPVLAVHEAAEALLLCVCAALDALPEQVPTLAGCPCRTGVVPGLPAADACDGGCGPLAPGDWPGQLTVNTVRLFTTDANSFPRETLTVRDRAGCAVPQVTAAELAVTVWRCTPLPSDEGCPPPVDELTASAMQLHADMLAVQQAVLCCFAATTEARRGRRYVMGGSTVLGPAGGCVGFTTRVLVDLGGTVGPIPAGPQAAAQGPGKAL